MKCLSLLSQYCSILHINIYVVDLIPMMNFLISKALSINALRMALVGSFRRSIFTSESRNAVSASAVNFLKDEGIANSVGKNFERDVHFLFVRQRLSPLPTARLA